MANGQDLYRQEIIKCLHDNYGINRPNPAIPFDPSKPFVKRPVRHSADDLCTIPYNMGDKKIAAGFYMELKTGKKGSLPFGTADDGPGWRQGQIDWGKLIYSRPFYIPLLLVVIWDDQPIKNKVSRRLQIVPFSLALRAIQAIEPIQKTIPYSLSKQSRLALRENNLCAEHLWGEWEAPRVVGGWDIYDVFIRALEYEWNFLNVANATDSGEIKKPA